MALSSVSYSIYRDNSPLSPTVIHYHQKYQKSKLSQHCHRKFERQHRFQKQQIRNTSRKYYYNQTTNRINKRRQSPCLWEIHQSSNGRIYYYNIITDQSQWEKPPREQLSSSFTKKFLNKRISNNNNHYHSKKSNQSISNSIYISDNDFDSNHPQSSHITTDNHKKYHNHHHKRRKDNIEGNSSFKKLRKDKRKTDEVILSTPISPPPNEIIQIDLVDPIPTPKNNITNLSIPFINSQEKSHYQISSTSTNENIFNPKQLIKTKINEDLSSIITQSSLQPSESTINAIMELEHLSPIKHQSSPSLWSNIINSNCNDITRYYRGELIEHLLNWPLTKIERESIRLSNEQIRITTCQLTSLRTDLFSIRLQFERNRFQLLKYHYNLVYQQNVLNKLQLIDSDQI